MCSIITRLFSVLLLALILSGAPLWAGSSSMPLQTFGLGQIHALAYSPDGQSLAVASSIGVEIWDTAAGTLLRQLFGHRDQVFGVAWSPDGRRLVSGSRDTTVRVWDAETGDSLATLTGQGEYIFGVGWSPDGNRLASLSNTKVRLWDARTGDFLRDLAGELLVSMAWSPDSRFLAVGNYRGPINLWDLQTGTVSRELIGHAGQANALAWSPDGARLASVGDDTTLRLWNVQTGAAEIRRRHKTGVIAVTWSPDGRRLASGAGDGVLHIWSADPSDAPIRTLNGHTRKITALSWSSADDALVSGSEDLTLRVWNPQTGTLDRMLPGHTALVYSITLSPDESQMAVTSENTIRILDLETGATREFARHDSALFALSWSPDGLRIASGGVDKTVKIWDAATGVLLNILTGHNRFITSISWSPDSSKLVSASADPTIRLWDANAGTLLRELEPDDHHGLGNGSAAGGADEGYITVRWSPDNRFVAAASGDRTVRVWDAVAGHHPMKIFEHGNVVYSVAWSPDAGALASGSLDGNVRIWDVATWDDPLFLTFPESKLHAVAWSPDGTRMAAGTDDFRIAVWDTKTAERQGTLFGHTNWIPGLIWSNQSGLISGSYDGTIRLWDPIW